MQHKENWDFNGAGELLLVDKPLEWTSMDVVKKVRSLFHVKTAGHAGTLDPKASGLLILCTGPLTKSIDKFVGLDKEYEGTLQLGIRTPSFDSETEVTEERDFLDVTDEKIRSAMADFVGKQSQIPPMYSAAKFGGKPLYKYARRGTTVVREPRNIEITDFTVVRIDLPRVEFRVACSKGTYIRSLVDDIGQKLGCGACLMSLRRTRIGNYYVGDASTIEALVALAEKVRPKLFSRHETSVPA
ncbi:MAG: tRNA pseudouridine(55) synthase TruB [Ignavibacteriales bacterium]|nr:tRNA pseudouridine(55) synthase TruB [Ignavibacteriales bacterium]